MAVHFKKGFSDSFQAYAHAANGMNESAMAAAKAAGANYIRFPVSWAAVERTGAGAGIWVADSDFANRRYDYVALAQKAAVKGLKVLPVISGCPTSWLTATDRAPCQPTWAGLSPPKPTGYYPVSATALNAYSDFVVRVVQFFVQRGVGIDAVQVWNEPNLVGTAPTYANGNGFAIHNRAHYSAILANVIAKVNTTFSGITTVAAGLYMNAFDDSSWKNYLDGYVNQCYSYALAIHPYANRDDISGSNDQTVFADACIAKILSLFQSADDYLLATHGISTMDIWVTETGSHSRAPLDQAGQKRVIANVLGDDVGLDLKSKCKAAMAYRLYPFDQDDHDPETMGDLFDGSEGSGQFYKSNLMIDWGMPKLAYDRLKNEWT